MYLILALIWTATMLAFVMTFTSAVYVREIHFTITITVGAFCIDEFAYSEFDRAGTVTWGLSSKRINVIDIIEYRLEGQGICVY